MNPRLLAFCGALTAMLLAACGGAAPEDPAPAATGVEGGGLAVTATTTIVGDIVEEVLGDAGTVEVLLPPGSDPHDFEPSAAAVARMSEADMVVANGLGLEEGLRGALETAAAEGATVFELGDGYDTILGVEDRGEPAHDGDDQGSGQDHGDPADDGDHDHAGGDPHIWLDPRQMADAVLLLGDELVAAGAQASVRESARAYHDALLATDAEVAEILSSVPAERRVLVTNHDTMAYFAARYDFTVAGAAIPSTSSTAESSAGQLAALAEAVRAADVPAVFADSTVEASLVHTLAEEAGRPVEVVTLLTDALAPPGEEGDSYRSLLTVNAQRIADALS